MKILGKRSAASILHFIVNAAWLLQIFGMGVLLIVMIATYFKPSEDFTRMSLPVMLNDVDVQILFEDKNITDVTIEEAKANASFLSHTHKHLIIYGIIGVLILTYTLYITYLLRKVTASLTQGSPFLIENAHRLRKVAFFILAAAPMKFALERFSHIYNKANFSVVGASLDTSVRFDVQLFIAGLVLLVIAEVFRIGTQLQEEQTLTI